MLRHNECPHELQPLTAIAQHYPMLSEQDWLLHYSSGSERGGVADRYNSDLMALIGNINIVFISAYK